MIDLTLLHSITDASDLRARLVSFLRDARVTEHVTSLRRHPSGLIYRFSGPSIESGELSITPATPSASGVLRIQLHLKGLAWLAEGRIQREIEAVAQDALA